jgi:hypothetical protein
MYNVATESMACAPAGCDCDSARQESLIMLSRPRFRISLEGLR